MRTQRRFSIENLEERANPAPFNIGQGTGVFTFNVAGFDMFQNNENAATVSNAFGFSEASMTAAGVVDTAAGGTSVATLTDAFDGVFSWGITDGAGNATTTTYVDADGIVDITPLPTGPGNLTTTPGSVLTGDPSLVGSDGAAFNGLQLQQQNAVFVVNGAPVIRSIIFVSNPTGAAITQRIGCFNNVGSDDATAIHTTSSGDAVYTDGVDRWFVNIEQFAGGASPDVRTLFVLQGSGAVPSPAITNGAIGTNFPDFNYDLTVNPGETKALMVFASLHRTRAAAAAQGATFDTDANLTAAGLLAGLTQAQIDQIENWDFAPPGGGGGGGGGGIVIGPPLATSTDPAGIFIERLYNDLLGRRPDSGADPYIQNLLTGERDARDVAYDVLNSQEYLTKVLTNLYNTFLDRAPDPAGLLSYVREIQGGKTIEDVTVEILSSTEYRANAANATSFVTNIFRDVLGRTPDASDLVFYRDRYGTGTRGEVEEIARDLVYSKEARGNAVDAAYALMLNRPADELSRIAYIGNLQTGRSIIDVLAEMAASPEYNANTFLI